MVVQAQAGRSRWMRMRWMEKKRSGLLLARQAATPEQSLDLYALGAITSIQALVGRLANN